MAGISRAVRFEKDDTLLLAWIGLYKVFNGDKPFI
jgi:hypothetical protein